MPVTDSFDAGFECKLYVGNPGEDPATEVLNIRDLNYDTVIAKLRTTTRRDGDMETYRPGRNDLTITFNMPWNPLRADFLALLSAFQNRAALSAKITDAAGTRGFVGDWNVYTFSRQEPEDGVTMVSVSLSPTGIYDRVPESFEP